jgi:Mor family transcriptional regulator
MTMPLPMSFNEADLHQMKILYKNGESAVSLAKIFSCSDVTIRKYLKRQHVKTTGLLLREIEIKKLQELYKNGATAVALAKKFKCSDVTIHNYLKRTGILLRGRWVKTYIIDKDELRSLYEKGWTAEQLAERYDCYSDVIFNRLKEFGIPRFNGRLKPVSIKIPSDPAVLAYIAGIIDGEGTIDIFHDGNKSQIMRPHMTVANTHIGMLKFLVKTIGGNYSKNSTPSHCKQCYHWSLYRASDILALTLAIQPYLIIKKEGAKRVIQKCKEFNRTRVYSIS